MAFQVRYLALFLLLPVIDGFEWFSMESLLKNLMNFLMMLTAIYADDTTLYSKCDQASDLWQQLELASELESHLRDTVDWGWKNSTGFV